MRHLIILIVVSVISLPLNAQSSSKVKEKTLKLFEGYAYYDVINNYKKLRNLDIEEKRILGLSYWKTNQLTSAEDVFSQIVELEDHSSDDLFHYACILRENQDYETSLIWMNKFTEMAPEDSRAIDFLEHENEIQPDEEDDIHKVNRLLMNTEDQDFGTSYFGDKLVFSSTRRLSRMILRKWNGNNRAFLKVCVADITMDGELEEVEELKEFTNEKFHNGPIAFNSEGDMMVITQNASGTDLKKGPMNLQLFVSYLENEKWSKPEPFSFNSKEYSCGQATISADGKWV